MRVLVACESSGTVRDAFIAVGHDAVSCDILPTESPGPHIQGDVRGVLGGGWDFMLAFPPCTNLASSGAQWFAAKGEAVIAESLAFVRLLMDAPIERKAIENPVGLVSSRIRPCDQIIQPWMFGDEATKTTCLWLTGLPLLKPTAVVGRGERHVTKSGRSLPSWYNLPPSDDRQRIRSRTFAGIAAAMAAQWGDRERWTAMQTRLAL